MAGALCTTPTCMNYSSYLQSLMAPANMSVDPCTDFSKFVCHGASSRFEKGGQTIASVDESVKQALKDIIESDFESVPKNISVFPKRDSSTDQTLFDTAKRGYQACMDEAAIKAQGVSPLRRIVEQVTNMFPTANHGFNASSEKTGNQSVSDVLIYFQELGVVTFTKMGVQPNPFDPERNAIVIGPPSSNIGSALIRRGDKRKRQAPMPQEIIPKLLKALMPGNISDEESSRLGTGVADLTAKITEIDSLPERENPVEGVSSMSVADAVKLGPVFGHEKVIQALVADAGSAGNVTVQDPEIISSISKLVSDTPKDLVQAFLVSRVAETFAEYFPELAPAESPQKRGLVTMPIPTRQKLTSGPKETPRWQTCIEHIQISGAAYALERSFVAAASIDKSKSIAENMMGAIKEQFIQSLANITWMSENDKAQAENKTRRIIDVVGFSSSSPKQEDADDIAAYYTGLNITNDFFANVLSYRSWNNKRQFSRAGKPSIRDSFDNEHSTLVNGNYSPDLNRIAIFPGIMQAPIFHPDLPSYSNYGGLGTVLGHEITHGFDDQGSKYDPSGIVRMWWSKETVTAFEDRTKCFVGQYDNMTVSTTDGEKPINGSLTLGENIADAGGLHLAFDAWKSQSKADEMKIPGLERFTPEQMFYIAHGTVWCGNPDEERAAELLELDPHAPGLARIVGATANSRGFREAFNCPVKEPSCELW